MIKLSIKNNMDHLRPVAEELQTLPSGPLDVLDRRRLKTNMYNTNTGIFLVIYVP